MTPRAFADCRLYAFVDTAYLDGRDPSDLASRLCGGGADIVQLRAKGLDEDAVRRMAESILPTVAAAGAWFVLNDHERLARELHVPCLHLGQEDFFDAGHRHVDELSARKAGIAVGLSTHAPDQCVRAVAAGADYVAIGPVFATPTKPGRPAATLEYVRWAAANVRVPWFAIGGIDATTLGPVLEAGATRVCVVGAILRAPDPAAACSAFRRRLP